MPFSSQFMICIRRLILYLTVAVVVIAPWGCQIFKQGRGLLHKNAKLPSIQAPPDAVQLDIAFVERPIDDRLLGDALWQEVDQIGALEPAVRKKLTNAGFRIGVAGSSPPRALQLMLGLGSPFDDDSSLTNEKKSSPVRHIVLPPGQFTEIQTSPIYQSCTIEIPSKDGPEAKDFSNTRCLFRVKVHRLQDGWAKLEFLPEIHYGENRLRVTATEGGWRQRTTQKVEPLYNQRFEIELSVGEMVLITVDGTNVGSAGRHFFVGADKDAKVQRLLVVRLADMGNTESPYADK